MHRYRFLLFPFASEPTSTDLRYSLLSVSMKKSLPIWLVSCASFSVIFNGLSLFTPLFSLCGILHQKLRIFDATLDNEQDIEKGRKLEIVSPKCENEVAQTEICPHSVQERKNVLNVPYPTRRVMIKGRRRNARCKMQSTGFAQWKKSQDL